MKKLAIVFLTLIFVVGLGGAFWGLQFLTTGAGPRDEKVLFEIAPGSSFSRVAQDLESQGLIESAFKFKIYAKVRGKTGQIRVGEYELKQTMSPRQIMRVISSGVSVQRTFTIPEGYNIFEIADILGRTGIASRDKFLEMFRSRTLTEKYLQESLESFEGYLFPETYSYTKYTSAEKILEMMVSRFLTEWGSLGQQQMDMTRHQVVTLASVIEKETGAPEERAIIASVFHNRLNKRMRLQSDPTILYGILMQTGQMRKNITKNDILAPTPYNTYTVPALPKGPIASPGKDSLMAALNPLRTDFLFFVSRNDGTHVFTKTYDEHRRAVRDYQLNRNAREGRSWRDLQKRKTDQ